MQFTFPNYYNKFSCIAGACPDTCCAGWQIVIDDKTLKKYQHFKGPFRNRLHNDIDWKEHVFRQYNRRCAFLNEENLCDIYTEAGPKMFCKTCHNYPRHIEEFEGLREISLSLSCPEAARILLSQKEKVQFVTREKETHEEVYDDFDYLLFTALMDTRDMLIDVIQDRNIPMQKRLWKVLAIAHDFQLCVDKNELFKWEEIRKRHVDSGYGEVFCNKIYSKILPFNSESATKLPDVVNVNTPDTNIHNTNTTGINISDSDIPDSDVNYTDISNTDSISKNILKEMWKTIVPEMEVLRPGWQEFLKECLTPLYKEVQDLPTAKVNLYPYQKNEFDFYYPDWQIQEEQLLVYWIYTYFCGAVYDDEIFAKVKMAVVCTLFIHELSVGTYLKNNRQFCLDDQIQICYQFSRELEHSDLNLNKFEELMSEDKIFSFENLLKVC